MNLDLTDLLKLPVPIIVALFCNAVGFALKKAEFFPDKYIPLILPLIGSITFTAIQWNLVIIYDVNNPIVYHAILGFLIGSSSVGIHQIFKGKSPEISSAHTESESLGAKSGELK